MINPGQTVIPGFIKEEHLHPREERGPRGRGDPWL